MSDWNEYYERTKHNPPQPLLLRAVPFVTERKAALDLGSGALIDSSYLLSIGFETVVAVDREPLAARQAEKLPAEKFRYVITTMEQYEFPNKTFDLVNAQYALPFIRCDQFDDVWLRIRGSLKPSGIFTGQLFGDRDSWSGANHMTFHSRAQAEGLLLGYNIIEFTETESDGFPTVGPLKHWHLFHFIAKN